MLRMKGGIYIGFICERKTYRGFCNQVKNIKVARFNANQRSSSCFLGSKSKQDTRTAFSESKSSSIIIITRIHTH